MNKQMRQRAITVLEKQVMPVPECGCWIWPDDETLSLDGYEITADRMAYEIFNGPLLESEEITHKCHLNCCVNPEHLSLKRCTPGPTRLSKQIRFG